MMLDALLNKLIYAIISGQAFFIGSCLLVVGVVAESGLVRRRERLGERVAGLMVLLGAFLIALSSSPLPVWLYILGAVATAAYLVCLGRASGRSRRLSRAALVVVVLAGVIMEWPYHASSPVPSKRQRAIYVLGDSISAGIGQPDVVPYPELLQKEHHVPVTNLAVSGCNVRGAVSTLPQIRDPAGLILIEIGGIDLFQHPSTADFARDLAELLRRAATPQRTVVMLELPLTPFSWGYGRVQRRLARDHRVVLVPKHVLSGVLCSPGAADPVDRIHLTQSGQELMAESVWPWLAPNIAK